MAMTSDHYNQDYRSPRTMTSTPGQNGPPHQLDFYQAMADFRHMFPNMEEEVIEAVLRSNNGAVDATIDQLLTMNAENNEGNIENKSTKPGPDNQGASPAPPPYPTGAAEMPPSYQDYTKSVEQATQTQVSPEKPEPVDKFLLDIPVPAAESAENNQFSAKGDEVLGATGGKAACHDHLPTLQIKGHSVTSDDTPSSAEPLSAPVPQVPVKMPLFNHNYTPAHSLTPKRLYKGWTPGLLGQLPDDFLRITINAPAECHHCHHHTQSSPSSMSSSSPNTPPIQRSKLRRSKPGSQNSSPRPASVGSRSPRPLRASGQEELSSEMIQQRMMENERKRSLHADTDPTALQMLEDERLALMLQNEEFLTELMSDEDFLTTLERDRMNATAFEPPSQHETPELGPEGPRSDYIEGYGDDRDVTLGAFPFDRSVPGVKERDRKAEFRRQLNNMGGSSKKKLVAAAKRFFSRKKKSSKQLYPYPGYELPIEFKGYNNLEDPGHTPNSRDTGQDLYFQNQYAL